MLQKYLLPFARTQLFTSVPSDIQNGYGLGARIMGVPMLHESDITGEGFLVGVVDTGIYDQHPDLIGKVIKRRDYVRDGVAQINWSTHGTHVAGIIAADGDLKGIAYKAKLADYRVVGVDGYGDDNNVAQAIIDAVNDGCHVVNISLGSDQSNANVHNAIKYAVSRNIPVIVAAGNEGSGRISYPAMHQEVISVGSVDIASNLSIYRSFFSNSNPEVDVAAHGGWVISTVQGGYEGLAGTSMACPHVAGFMVLLLYRSLMRLGYIPSEQVAWEMLKSTTADDEIFPGVDNSTGAGIVTIFPNLPKIRKVSMTKDVPAVVVDGISYPRDVAPYKNELAGRIFAPVRFQAEPFGVKVSSDLYGNTAFFEQWYIPGFDKVTSK